MKTYTIVKTTLHPIKHSKEPLRNHGNSSEDCDSMANEKALHLPRLEVLDKNLYHWFCAKCFECMTYYFMANHYFIAKAKSMHNDMKLIS